MIVNYQFAIHETRPPRADCLYEYVVGSNGIFVQARRPGLSARIWVAPTLTPLRGLLEVDPFVKIDQRVPEHLLDQMFVRSFYQGNKEILFYLKSNPWRVTAPRQVQSAGGVRPVDPFEGGTDTILELHSHHHMSAFFSATDNRDEQSGFRLFAVIGDLQSARPTIRARVGIYGHFWEIPAGWVFDLPGYARDAAPEYGRTLRYERMESYA